MERWTAAHGLPAVASPPAGRRRVAAVLVRAGRQRERRAGVAADTGDTGAPGAAPPSPPASGLRRARLLVVLPAFAAERGLQARRGDTFLRCALGCGVRRGDRRGARRPVARRRARRGAVRARPLTAAERTCLRAQPLRSAPRCRPCARPREFPARPEHFATPSARATLMGLLCALVGDTVFNHLLACLTLLPGGLPPPEALAPADREHLCALLTSCSRDARLLRAHVDDGCLLGPKQLKKLHRLEVALARPIALYADKARRRLRLRASPLAHPPALCSRPPTRPLSATLRRRRSLECRAVVRGGGACAGRLFCICIHVARPPCNTTTPINR